MPIEATNEQSESVSASASAVEQSQDKNEVCLGSQTAAQNQPSKAQPSSFSDNSDHLEATHQYSGSVEDEEMEDEAEGREAAEAALASENERSYAEPSPARMDIDKSTVVELASGAAIARVGESSGQSVR